MWSTPAVTAQLLKRRNYIEYKVAEVAMELCTGAKGREVLGMVSKWRKVKFKQCRLGLRECQSYIFEGQR